MREWLTGRTTRREFERFVDEATESLVRTGYLMTFDLHETEDLVQETLLAVAKRWDRVRSMAYPRAYARRVLVNLVLDGTTRRSRRRAELVAADDHGGAVDHEDEGARLSFELVEADPAIHAALAALPRRQRAVLVLRFFEDLSEAAVADELGCTVGTVKSTSSRALQRLRATIGATTSPPVDPLVDGKQRSTSSC